ncbi:MAG: beta-propeller domain-containing protein [Candidatus Bathyarchaeia archaeon]
MSGRLRLTSYVLLGIVCGSLILNAAASFSISPLILKYEPPGFNSFKSRAELAWFLEEKAKVSENNWRMGLGGVTGGIVTFSSDFAIVASAATAAKTAAEAGGYSTTNIQVAGVDEADVVKTDGTYIYLSKGDTVYIVLAYPAEEAKLLTKIKFDVEVSDLFVAGDKLVVFTRGYGRVYTMSKGGFAPTYMMDTTAVYFYDISDRVNPVRERTYEAEGAYVATRLIGDYVYVISQKGAWVYRGVLELPAYSENGKICQVPVTNIYYYNGTDPSYAYTTVASINAQDPGSPVASKTFLLGSSGTVFCSAEYLYLTTGGYSSTGVHKIRLENGAIEGVADGSVPGWILNQYSMDESGGYFRIATTTGQAWGVGTSRNNVYVLDPDMKIVGTLEDLAPGEQIYSARFMGDRLYLVTFKKVDPLFVIDLSEPTAPRVLGKLKIPGYSNYLHPYDETHVIGLGKEAVDSEGGSFAWYQGVKLSLFDVSNVSAPVEVAKLEIGDRGTDSPALYDFKAFLFSRERNLLVIPILEAKVSGSYGVEPNAYGDFVYQGAYVFQIDTEGIALRGRITHLQGDELLKSGYWFESESSVYRSLYIGENLYTISGAMVKINSLGDLSELKAIPLE